MFPLCDYHGSSNGEKVTYGEDAECDYMSTQIQCCPPSPRAIFQINELRRNSRHIFA